MPHTFCVRHARLACSRLHAYANGAANINRFQSTACTGRSPGGCTIRGWLAQYAPLRQDLRSTVTAAMHDIFSIAILKADRVRPQNFMTPSTYSSYKTETHFAPGYNM